MFDQTFEHLIRSLAYDSDDCKSYMVHPDKAKEVYGKSEIEEWLEKYLVMVEKKDSSWKEKLAHDSPIRVAVVNYAVKAGTPMCLVRCVQLIGSN